MDILYVFCALYFYTFVLSIYTVTQSMFWCTGHMVRLKETCKQLHTWSQIVASQWLFWANGNQNPCAAHTHKSNNQTNKQEFECISESDTPQNSIWHEIPKAQCGFKIPSSQNTPICISLIFQYPYIFECKLPGKPIYSARIDPWWTKYIGKILNLKMRVCHPSIRGGSLAATSFPCPNSTQ